MQQNLRAVRIRRSLCRGLSRIMLVLLMGACGDDSIYTISDYIITVEVTGVAAAADVAYTDLAINPATDIFTDAAATVPYSRSVTESLDYTANLSRQASVIADVAVGETLTLIVYYEDVSDFPPDNNRRIVEQKSYANPGAATVTGHEIIISFLLPVQ